MEKLSYDNQMLVQYLLGSLPKAETTAFGKLSIVDDEFVARLQEVENDLVDAYVRGELSSFELMQFRSYYLASPHRRKKVEIARAFQAFAEQKLMAQQAVVATAATPVQPSLVEETAPVSLKEKESPWRVLRNFFLVPRAALQWGFAALALLLLVGSGALALKTWQMREQVTQAQSEHAALQQREQALQAQLTQQQAANADTEQELARVREQLARLEQQRKLEAQRARLQLPTLPREPNLAYFDLAPQTRGLAQPPDISLPRNADYVVWQLELEAENASGYRVELWDQARRSVWKSGRLKARSRGERKVLDVKLPARQLPPQRYILKVTSISADGTAEGTYDYLFRIVP